MRRESEWLDKAVKLYKMGVSLSEIEAEVKVPRKRISTKFKKMIASGELEERKALRKGPYKNSKHHRMVEDIITYAALGKPYTELCEKYGVKEITVTRAVLELEKQGIIERTRVRKKRECKPRGPYKPRDKKIRSFESTLEPGETIKCTAEIKKQCIYGNFFGDECRYFSCTGQLRSMGPEGCKQSACSKFSKISKENPRVDARD